MNKLAELIGRNRDVLFVAAILAIMTTIFVPLPPFLLDFLLVISITVSVLILMTVIYVREPVKFSVFPSILLMTTAYRLALNVAVTRQILGNAGREGTGAAGRVVEAFGNFVAAADPLIGFVIFVILIIVNFIVITKGAGRVSEVAARFTLDAMPGKQMAIDADLNAGLIKESEARERRRQVAREADFYGAMDGASKFVRGDAIAGIIITLVNIGAGFALGWLKYNMPPSQALHTFTILTIGDGLVAQIPALIVSLAAGLIVTRAGQDANLGRELVGQLFAEKKALWLTMGFIGLLLMSAVFLGSGLPWFQLLVVGGFLAVAALVMGSAEKSKAKAEAEKKEQEAVAGRKPERVEGLLKVDPMEFEIGLGIVKLVDPSEGGAFLDRVAQIRREMAVDLGLVLPPVRIRDNESLEPNSHSIKIRGSSIATASVRPDLLLAIDTGSVVGPIEGLSAREPAFGLKAFWIRPPLRETAEALGYQVAEPATVMSTHLTENIKRHAHGLSPRDGGTHTRQK